MKNKGNILLVILIIVGVVAAAVGGYFWWQKQKGPEQPYPFGGNYYKTIPDSKSKEATSSADETANWKTYVSVDLGFSFKYPNSWGFYPAEMLG